MREKGFAHPVIIILLFVITSSFILFTAYLHTATQKRVKGVSKSLVTAGLSVAIKSSDTWDFVELLCSDFETCTKHSTISGGAVADQELIIMKEDSWTSASYLKLFAKPSWGSRSKSFSVTSNNSTAKTTTVTVDGNTYEALVLPISEVSNNYIESVAVFDNRSTR